MLRKEFCGAIFKQYTYCFHFLLFSKGVLDIQQCFRLNCGVFKEKIFLLVIKRYYKNNIAFPRCVTLLFTEKCHFMQV